MRQLSRGPNPSKACAGVTPPTQRLTPHRMDDYTVFLSPLQGFPCGEPGKAVVVVPMLRDDNVTVCMTGDMSPVIAV